MTIIPDKSRPLGRRLLTLYQQHVRMDRYEPIQSDADLFSITERMQEEFPGNYIVEECFRPDLVCWGPRLVFATDEDATMFLLKWG
jgi:hypothetical protein